MLEPTCGTAVVTALIPGVVIYCIYSASKLEICLSSSESTERIYIQEWKIEVSVRQDKTTSNELARTGVNRSDISVEDFLEPR